VRSLSGQQMNQGSQGGADLFRRHYLRRDITPVIVSRYESMLTPDAAILCHCRRPPGEHRTSPVDRSNHGRRKPVVNGKSERNQMDRPFEYARSQNGRWEDE